MTAPKKATGRKATAESSPEDLQRIEEYLTRTTAPARKMLEEIRETVRANAPAEAIEVFSYGMPGFRYKGSLLWYGAFKNHCGFYPGSPPMILSLAEDLKGYKTSKGAVQFPIDRPAPVALVKKIVKLRVKENEARQRS
jgi:uncharacterized protein YdhG (YjbR/CyaY superfamily)